MRVVPFSTRPPRAVEGGLKCLEADPARRYESLTELADALAVLPADEAKLKQRVRGAWALMKDRPALLTGETPSFVVSEKKDVWHRSEAPGRNE